MPNDTREPQSYGSDSDWLTGKTGQKVNEPAPAPTPDFPERGGLVSEQQLAENQQPDAVSSDVPEDSSSVQKVTSREGGAKRDSYFKKRDYE
jgi:hypothetical protein